MKFQPKKFNNDKKLFSLFTNPKVISRSRSLSALGFIFYFYLSMPSIMYENNNYQLIRSAWTYHESLAEGGPHNGVIFIDRDHLVLEQHKMLKVWFFHLEVWP